MFSRPSVQLKLKLFVVAPAPLSAALEGDYPPLLARKDALEITVEQLAVGRGHFKAERVRTTLRATSRGVPAIKRGNSSPLLSLTVHATGTARPPPRHWPSQYLPSRAARLRATRSKNPRCSALSPMSASRRSSRCAILRARRRRSTRRIHAD